MAYSEQDKEFIKALPLQTQKEFLAWIAGKKGSALFDAGCSMEEIFDEYKNPDMPLKEWLAVKVKKRMKSNINYYQ